MKEEFEDTGKCLIIMVDEPNNSDSSEVFAEEFEVEVERSLRI
jgi:hypothetical protein